MKKIDIDELKQIQLQILDDVTAFCEKENLTYYLAYGTLIGAIRHNGYIPWDDDIDIAMPRKDYEYFCKNYNKNTSKYRICEFETDPEYLYAFGKVIDTETRLIENCHIKYDLGVNIDVFPLDKVDAEGRMIKHEQLIRKIIFVKTMPWDDKKSLLRNIILTAGRVVCSVIPLKSLIKYTINYGKKLQNDDTGYVSVPVEGAYNLAPWNEELFKCAVPHEFEGRTFMIPNGYNEWLTSLYGDYMQLPPEDKRASLHDIEAYWR